MSDMLIIVPVLGRPHSVGPLWESWQATTDNARLVLAADEDDPTLPQYRDEVRHTGFELRVGPPLWTAPKLNEVIKERQYGHSMIGFWGDDNRPRTPHWDTRFVDALRELGTGMVYGNDLLQGGDLPCSVVMTADIPKTLGYMAFPGAKHLCIDVAWKEWGRRINRLSYLSDVVIEHLHSANGKAPFDSTYRLGNSATRVREDTAAYYQYRDLQMHTDVNKLLRLIR